MTHHRISDAEVLLTGEDLLNMGVEGPCELIDGRVVPVSPTGGEHAYIESQLGSELRLFIRERDLGWVLVGEVGVYTRRNPDRVRGADIVVLSRQRMSGGPPRGFLESAPDVLIEILSPTDRWQEILQKVEEYFAAGADQVWVVEPENRAVLVYSSPADMRKFEDEDTLVGGGVLEGFELRVSTIFD